ncbi:MAG: DUF58 domain-containing protein [Rhodospirillales bacterium]|nr:DUF58 domain-containing protein [Rhodospirillales bacterium]
MAERGAAGLALAGDAASLAARLPALLLAAERIAATISQGVHGRRRGGPGDSFWQFRPYAPGDPPARIDWRQAARAGRPAPQGWVVRESEWEASQSLVLWVDASPSMGWRSDPSLPEKRERALVLALGLAALALRGGEQVAAAAPEIRPLHGEAALARLGAALLAAPAIPPEAAWLPRHARLVLIGDFLPPDPPLAALLRACAARQVGGALLELRDPAEETLPYAGRLRFDGLEGETPYLARRAEALRAEYLARVAARRAALAEAARAAGFAPLAHRTDAPAAEALLALYQALVAR